MKALSHYQLAHLVMEDLSRFLQTGTVSSRHAQLALFVAVHQDAAEKQLSEFLIGDPTAIADQVGHAWHVLCTGCGLIHAASIVQGATAVLMAWEARERARPEWLQVQLIELETAAQKALAVRETRNDRRAQASDGADGAEASGFLS